MVFFETSCFTKAIKKLLSDDEYKDPQSALINEPEAGTGIAGGLRRLRWSVSGKRIRGGIRGICYYITDTDRVLMLTAYKKGVQDNLTKAQAKVLVTLVLATLVKEELGDV